MKVNLIVLKSFLVLHDIKSREVRIALNIKHASFQAFLQIYYVALHHTEYVMKYDTKNVALCTITSTHT